MPAVREWCNAIEAQARARFSQMEGWGTFSPISVSFDLDKSDPDYADYDGAALDLNNIKSRHQRDDYDFADDAVYLVNLTTGLPVPLDVGSGNFNYTLKKLDKIFPGPGGTAPEAWAWIRMYQLLGANPTPITWGEVYTALQTKVVDGMDCPTQMILDMKFYEVAKHVLLVKNMFSSISLIMNNGFYNGLPNDIKKAVNESAKEAIDYINWEVSYKLELKAVDKLKKLGLTVDYAKPNREAWEKNVIPQHEEFAKQKGPMAKELLEMVYKLK